MSDSTTIAENSEKSAGKRTVIRTLFHAGASVQQHYHTEFEETFHVIEGEMSIEVSGKRRILKTGQSLTVKKKKNHGFTVLSLSAVEITLEPASPSFEQAIAIIQGTAKDDFSQPGTMDDTNLLLTAVTAGLMNTTYVGELGEMLKVFSKKNRALIKKTKALWLEKYCGK